MNLRILVKGLGVPVTLLLLVTLAHAMEHGPGEEAMGMSMRTHHEHIKNLERLLKFERKLAAATGGFRIGYLYKRGDQAAEQDKKMMGKMAGEMIENKPGGHDVDVTFSAIDVGTGVDFIDEVEEKQINVIYTGAGLSDAQEGAVVNYAASRRKLVISSDRRHVDHGHAAAAIVARGGEVRLIISLPAVEKFAVDFDPRLFRLADEIIR